MIKAFAAAAGAVALAFSAMAAHAEPPPLSAYGALPAIEQVAISASGEKIAFIGVVGEQRRLVVQTVAGEPLGVIALGDSKIRDILWAGDEHVVIVNSKTQSLPAYGISEREFFIAQSYSLQKKRVVNLAGDAKDSLNVILNWPSLRQVNGKWYAYITTLNLVHPIIELQRVSLDNRSTEPIEKLGYDGEGWLIDANGTPQARSRYDNSRGFWSLGARRGAIWPDIYQVDARLDSPSLIGFGRDGRSLLVYEMAENGGQYIEVAPESGAKQEILTDGRNYQSIIFDPASKRAIGANYFDGDYHKVFFDPADQANWEKVQRAFKGQRVGLAGWSHDRQRVIVEVDGPTNPGVYYLVDLAAKRADIVGELYPGVPADAVAEVKPYSYKAADGLTIPAYLTLPRGRDPRGLPLIVLAHGGPQSYDSAEFQYDVQALASRGYAVLQANFRGSDGYGDAHVEAGYGEWGRKMQTDLSDGVKALAAEGIIDPKRVCIMGSSYGGYAAMAGVTIQSGVYRCSVAISGVADLREFLKWEGLQVGRKTETMRYWRRFMGVDGGRDRDLDAISPLRQAAKANAPILLIHGKDDTVVPYYQSAKLADALRGAGKPVEMVTLNGEDHWMSRSATRLQALEAAVNFLLRENPPQ
jgi:dipeptidyl aminopeptidase/acylaminoacyl peptidase